MRIGICQLQSDIGAADHDPRPANLARAREAIAAVAADGAQLVVFGETFLNGYGSRMFTTTYAVAERADDPFVAALIDEATTRDVWIVTGATTHKGAFPGDVYNSALVIGPGRLAGVYNKAHLAALITDRGAVAEKLYWSPGAALPVFDTPYGRIGIEICYDIWFPEVARTLTLKGAELIVNLSAALAGGEQGWDHNLYTRALENVVPYLHVSVVGRQGDVELSGGSRLCGPTGQTLARAPLDSEAVMTVDLDPRLIFDARGRLHPFANRNPALYAEIAR